MSLTREDLQAIAQLLDDKLDSRLKPISDRLERIEIKQEVMTRRFDDLEFRVASIDHTQKKEFQKLNDEVDTLIAVLEAKEILPKQA